LWTLVEGATRGLPDVEAFLRSLSLMETHPSAEARGLFGRGDLWIARAPGRVDVMGGIADYSGSLVLQLPTQEATLVALQKDPQRRLRVVSLGAERHGRAASFEMPLEELEPGGAPLDYAAARTRLGAGAEGRWSAYVAGVVLALRRETGVRFATGARLLIASDVPEGKGVASSAALEVSVLQAVAAAFGARLSQRDSALLAQKAENLVVGAPCGVMDQMTAACGEEGRLLRLLCQPALLQEGVAIPDDLSIWAIDSGVRHEVSGSDYTAVRVGAFMGYRIVAELAGLRALPREEGRVEVEDPRWGGYLANIDVEEFRRSFADDLPERLGGSDFLVRYGGTTDVVTRVDPGRDYAVRIPAAHPIEEHARAREFAERLAEPASETRRRRLGQLMYASHGSYSRCGLGSPGTDRIVELVHQAGPAQGLYGARITGGGSGGTVAVLAGRDAGDAVATVAARYAAETDRRPQLFSGSSPGAGAFGCLRLTAAGGEPRGSGVDV
jgi:galactokinase